MQKTPAVWLPACPRASAQSYRFCCYLPNALILLLFACFPSSLSEERDRQEGPFPLPLKPGFPSTASLQDLYLTKPFYVSAADQTSSKVTFTSQNPVTP